ncbi:TPA: lipoprotein localization protein LolB [Pasteurella multocida]|uniref:lipoprotein insertase outer membrane protein LolB n=1 Tax=Pasteurella multocida TaxID=747 RepID=UPI00145AD281|nr:lipoprotein insertase outer membrane protein LolB [Pasteurella multocida]NMK15084.1 lipoprotein localization protein LolB [Pasteurella multocida]URH76973.1 lipoprotein insertase outer membrane protein LolB [Pasteurella multocida]URH90906.1 lipoprotein insertase outer membrane protein LolB [Pasteurella multocida]HDR1028082.1 lipoprotein localization protein LolB [Pasteurella multocida]HDR1065872.1 lipoprotein localization protein LolB [Pasteurella multocida]
MKKQHFLLPILASFFLFACTLDTERPTDVKYISHTDPTWQQHLSQLKKIRDYTNQGQLGYISQKERFSTRFDWQYQNPTNYRLTLSSTLSPTTLSIEVRHNVMHLSDNKGPLRSAQDAKRLLKEIVGMDLPLDQFALWLKGQPDESREYRVAENHLLAHFSYPIDNQQWTADYLSYHQLPLPLPKDILLKTEGQTLKIRIDNWTY